MMIGRGRSSVDGQDTTVKSRHATGWTLVASLLAAAVSGGLSHALCRDLSWSRPHMEKSNEDEM